MSSPKRRRTRSPGLPETVLSEIDEEVELDIALKQQLANTLESRIAWALMLQQTIEKGNGNASHATLRTVALDALSVIEHSSNYILCEDPVPPPFIHATRVSRPPSRKFQSFNIKSRPSFLYIRSNALVNTEGNPENHLYLLKCPGCSRTAFTSLQGLLNHARLTHNLEWGTHDECIRTCAVVDNDLDINSGIEVGVGPAGVLPGLRTIFQNAVGHVSGQTNLADSSNVEKQAPSVVNHLVQTLGLHEDSPALAPFLGKEIIRRQIKVWDEDLEVDLEAHDAQAKMRPWKMPFTPRNFDTAVTQVKMNHLFETGTERSEIEESESKSKPSLEISDSVVSNHSRFYFTTRIIITDRSLWIPVEQRPDGMQLYSYKWMISVDSPSYTHHITTVLCNVRVTPSESTHSMPVPPTAWDPPFVVVGYSDKSFLARVELSFSGTGPGLPEQKVVFEHWVDLDPFNAREPSTGQSRNKVLVGERFRWEGPSRQLNPSASHSILNDAVKQFPMTSNSGKENHSTLPYRSVSSLSQFRDLVTGRQKAIEWSRARAIRDAYTDHIRKLEDPNLIPFENGHFVRESGPPLKNERTLRDCDIKVKHPPTGSTSVVSHKIERHDGTDTKDSLMPLPAVSSPLQQHSCHIVPTSLQITELPRIDVSQTWSEDDRPEVHKERENLPIGEDVLSTVDPTFTWSVQNLVESMDLPTFRHPVGATHASGQISYPIDQYGKNRRDIDRNLLPVQILALLTKQFMRALIHKGLEVANRDKVIASGLLTTVTPHRGVRREAGKRPKAPSRIMTPTHILSGILTSGRGRSNVHHGLDAVLLSSLSRLGAGVDPSGVRQCDSGTFVKMEE
ncbi:hypothetical protein CPB84DRAFT_1847452 [Gymnopilus junonius]|uniref:YEATS domain-containing protein n=1 Tax=Gymnopilus junonius TaxID=109634 RepID=A0A9P5TMP9_GYMJU|nr:hypothetical protein CPB84DRAFT_1847452 [Gymnopilus junonius]